MPLLCPALPFHDELCTMKSNYLHRMPCSHLLRSLLCDAPPARRSRRAGLFLDNFSSIVGTRYYHASGYSPGVFSTGNCPGVLMPEFLLMNTWTGQAGIDNGDRVFVHNTNMLSARSLSPILLCVISSWFRSSESVKLYVLRFCFSINVNSEVVDSYVVRVVDLVECRAFYKLPQFPRYRRTFELIPLV